MQGLRICFTGNGKGKTTAACGLILRAVGHKKKVLLVQFIKSQGSGELRALERFHPSVVVRQMGYGFCGPAANADHAVHKEKAHEAICFVEQILRNRKKHYDLVVLDEINLLVKLRLVTVSDIIRILRLKPPRMHMVLTGRYAPKAVRDLCDLVSTIQEEKHPYRRGVPAQAVIEF